MYESRESSSPILTKTISAALKRNYVDSYEFSALEKVCLQIVGGFPQSFAQWLICRVQSPHALNIAQVEKIKLSDLIKERLRDYENLQEKYPAVTIGVGIGGAAGHLSLALNGPFLPQAFVLTLKGGAEDGDIQTYYDRSIWIARKITDRYPQLISIQHFDPIHDGWLTRSVNHLRLKLVELPEEYKLFIKRHLLPGGEVVYLEGKARWLQYLVGERNYFQVGGWGGISDSEFLEGSQRIRDYCMKNGLKEKPWKLSNHDLIHGYESEWGSVPGLDIALKKFCNEEGFKFIKVSFKNPHDFAKLAFFAQGLLLKKNQFSPSGVIVEMFSQYDLTAVMKSGLLPLWLIFNTSDSLAFLKSMINNFPAEKPVFFSPLSTFSLTPDMVPLMEWVNAFKGFNWVNIGARSSHYPADTRALVKWSQSLKRWADEKNIRIEQRITGEELIGLAKKI